MADDTTGSAPLTPEYPREEGVAAPSPAVEDVEPVHLLENEVRERLEADGFTDEQILRWIEAYVAEEGESDAEGLIAFIRAREQPGPSPG